MVHEYIIRILICPRILFQNLDFEVSSLHTDIKTTEIEYMGNNSTSTMSYFRVFYYKINSLVHTSIAINFSISNTINT